MKKIMMYLSIIIIMVTMILGCLSINNKVSQLEIADKLIRFHVIANSDTTADQALKLKVRDAVLNYVRPKLEKCQSIDESRKVLKNNTNEIIKIAQSIINKEKKNYGVKTFLGQDYFPVKTYGNITLPQGKYEAYKIIIGKGQGHNWWCVMFPPLCFVDINNGEVSCKKTEREMKKVLNNKEYEFINNQTYSDGGSNNIKIKFLAIEKIKKMFN